MNSQTHYQSGRRASSSDAWRFQRGTGLTPDTLGLAIARHMTWHIGVLSHLFSLCFFSRHAPCIRAYVWLCVCVSMCVCVRVGVCVRVLCMSGRVLAWVRDSDFFCLPRLIRPACVPAC